MLGFESLVTQATTERVSTELVAIVTVIATLIGQL